MPPDRDERQFPLRRGPAHRSLGRHRYVGLLPEDNSVSATVQGTRACVDTEAAQRARSLLSHDCPMKNTEVQNKFPARWFVNTDTKVDWSQSCLMSVNRSYHCRTHPENPSRTGLLTRRITKATSMQSSNSLCVQNTLSPEGHNLRCTCGVSHVVMAAWIKS